MLILGERDPAATWRYAERYLGGGTRTYSRFSADLEIAAQYHPQHGPPTFPVPTYWVATGASWLANRTGSPLSTRYRDGDAVLLPIHPEALAMPDLPGRAYLRHPGPPLEVVPSANSRTVFVERCGGEPVPPHFVKLHYPRRLSRFTRRLRRPVIELQLWVADQLSAIGAPFLPEVGGGVLGTGADAWGFLLREATVKAPARPPYTVPLLALYGRDVRAPADPTLLEQLIDHSGEDAETWVNRRVVEPIVTLWCETLLATGCALEPHGQNVLFQFSMDGRTTAVAYRDCAVYVDPEIRASRGMDPADLPPRNVISRDIDQPRAHVLSLVYDCFLGSHTLAYLARLVADRFAVPPAALHRFARKVFASYGELRDMLPRTVHYYDDQLHPDGAWQLVDTGLPSDWR